MISVRQDAEEDDAMTIDRREFVRLGALGSLGVLGASCQSSCPWFSSPHTDLRVQIKGLCIIERLGHAVTVHMVDAAAPVITKPLIQHFPFISVPTADV